jgi:predicted DNA-binding transcriptional regulator AlpA
MTAFFDFSLCMIADRAPRIGRQQDRLNHIIKRLCATRRDDAIAAIGGGSVGADAPAPRTPRRSASTASAKKSAARGSADGDGPARRYVPPLFLDLDNVAATVSLSTGSVQALVRAGDFPKPRALSARRVGWLLSEVEEWALLRPIADVLPPVNAGQRRAS